MYPPLILVVYVLSGKVKVPPLQITRTLFYYFAEKPWLPLADIIVAGYGNGFQLIQRKAIIDLDRANNRSVTALLSLHIQQFPILRAPTRNAFMKHPSVKSHCI